MEGDVTELRSHPMYENEDDRLHRGLQRVLMHEKIRQQQIINWVVIAAGTGVFLVVLGIAFVIWKFALTVDL